MHNKIIKIANVLLKFARNEKLLSTLDKAQVGQDVKDYVLSLERKLQGFALGKISQNNQIGLSELTSFINSIVEKENKIKKLKAPLVETLPNNIPEKYKPWFLKQFKKNPELKGKLTQRVDDIIRFVEDYDQQLASYEGEQILKQIDEEMRGTGADTDIFFNRVKKEENKKLARLHNAKLVAWAKKKFLECRKEWLKKIQKYCQDNKINFAQVLQEGAELMRKQEAGELRGQDLGHSPLHHNDHSQLLGNLEIIQDYVDSLPGIDISSFSIQKMLKETEDYHWQQSQAGTGMAYDPIDRSRIVYGPDQEGYFIIELKSENDLKVEGFLNQHCVGGYYDKVESARSRIFSLRNISAEYRPIITIETDPAMLIIRQDYGIKNSKLDEKLHALVNNIVGEITEENLNKLSIGDKVTLLENPNCPINILERFSNDPNMGIRLCIVQNPNCPSSILERLSNDPDPHIRLCVIEHRNCPVNILKRLSDNPDPYIRQTVAGNPNCPANILEKLSGDPDDGVIRAVVNNRSCPANILEKLSDASDVGIICDIFRNPNCPVNILEKLSRDPDEYIRQAIASNPNCPANILDGLSGDPNSVVRRNIAENPNCPISILEKLSGDPKYPVRQYVAANPNCPANILEKLSGDPHRGVRRSVAENPSCSVNALEKLSNDSAISVKGAVFENPNCPADLREKLRIILQDLDYFL